MSVHGMSDDDPLKTATLPRSVWKRILAAEPFAKETYTPEGEVIFAAWQALHRELTEKEPAT